MSSDAAPVPRWDAYGEIPDGRRAMAALERAAAGGPLSRRLRELLKVRASQLNGCSYCLDLHVRTARQEGETERRLAVLAGWRDTEGVFDDRELAALAFTDALTQVGVAGVPEDVRVDVEAVFSEAEIAALVFTVVAINAWNRLAVAQSLPLEAV